MYDQTVDYGPFKRTVEKDSITVEHIRPKQRWANMFGHLDWALQSFAFFDTSVYMEILPNSESFKEWPHSYTSRKKKQMINS